MKINSNTIKLEKESFEKLETVIKKIASENKIENVSGVQIKLSKENGIVKFAIIDDWADDDDSSGEEYSKMQELMDGFQIDAITAEKVSELISIPKSHNEASETMKILNDLIEGHGVEAIRKEGEHVDNYYFDIVATYINTGDTYAPTIIHDSETGEFFFISYGDFYEKWEAEHPKEENKGPGADYLIDKRRDDRQDFDEE